MKLLLCFLISTILLLVDHAHALPASPPREYYSSVITRDERERKMVRVKRAPLFKLPLLAGAALLGKKAVLLGGAAVGAKVVAGAGIVGAGLYKTRYYSDGYSGGHANYHYAPSSYVESSWG